MHLTKDALDAPSFRAGRKARIDNFYLRDRCPYR